MPTPSPKQKSSFFAGFSIFLVLLLIALLSAAGWFYVNKLKPMSDPLVKLKGALEKVTQQEITQSGYSLEIQTNEIKELATIERDFQSIIKYEATFLGAKKTIILRGDFTAKAGFDLERASSFSIENGKITGDLPKAQILSVEMKDYELYHSHDSAFNKLTPADQERAAKKLLEQANQDAENSDLRERAERQIKQRLNDLLGEEGIML